jgi:hypothetical protein
VSGEGTGATNVTPVSPEKLLVAASLFFERRALFLRRASDISTGASGRNASSGKEREHEPVGLGAKHGSALSDDDVAGGHW